MVMARQVLLRLGILIHAEQVKSGIQDVLRAGGHPVGPLVLRQLYFCVPSLQPSAGAGVLQEMVMMPMQYKGMTCGEVKERIFGKAPCLLRFEYEGDSTSALRTRLPESVQLAHAQPTSACLVRPGRSATGLAEHDCTHLVSQARVLN